MTPLITLSLLAAALTLSTAEISAGAPIGHPEVNEADRALHSAAAKYPNQGKALEVFQAGEYTYINIEKEEGSEWIAVATLNASKGDIIKYSKGSLMSNFHSKSLDRTFPEILFSGAADFVSGKHPSMAETASILNISGDTTELSNQGKVLSTIPTSMYTYIEVSHDGAERWLAVPSVELKVGDEIQYGDGAAMADFYSKSLDRKFSTVFFISKVVIVK
ncbi:MAG: hypothetical protein L3J28_02030 [Candidatus Polarisedimenticolaceae bacterium]|nr:hypothetical protein [Candidatus Polarisedimenticolaceae bacterium]